MKKSKKKSKVSKKKAVKHEAKKRKGPDVPFQQKDFLTLKEVESADLELVFKLAEKMKQPRQIDIVDEVVPSAPPAPSGNWVQRKAVPVPAAAALTMQAPPRPAAKKRGWMNRS